MLGGGPGRDPAAHMTPAQRHRGSGTGGGRDGQRRGNRAGPHKHAGRERTTTRNRGIGGEQVEGRRSVRELLASGRRRVREVIVSEGLEPSSQLDEIERLASKRSVRLSVVGRRRFDSLSKTSSSQGVLARAAPLEETPLEDLCGLGGDSGRSGAGRVPLLLVLEGISDPQNLGALLRSAECAGVTGVVLPRHRAAHITPTVTKVAAGAVEHLAMSVVAGIPNSIRWLTGNGVLCVGLDPAAATSLFELGDEAARPVALVLGAEGRGLSALTRRRCDTLASIPQHGSIGSLNVAAAGAVACFEMARRRDRVGSS